MESRRAIAEVDEQLGHAHDPALALSLGAGVAAVALMFHLGRVELMQGNALDLGGQRIAQTQDQCQRDETKQ